TWWVGHLLLHRVTALAALVRSIPLDPLHRFVLQALSLGPAASLPSLDDRLHLGRQFLGQVLRTLQSTGLAAPEDAAAWPATDLGRQAQHESTYSLTVHERRGFYFVEPDKTDSVPCFLALDHPAAVPFSPGEGWRFDPALLAACVARPADWKQRFG